MNRRDAEFSDLQGEVISKITGLEDGSDIVWFCLANGRSFRMFHAQD